MGTYAELAGPCPRFYDYEADSRQRIAERNLLMARSIRRDNVIDLARFYIEASGLNEEDIYAIGGDFLMEEHEHIYICAWRQLRDALAGLG